MEQSLEKVSIELTFDRVYANRSIIEGNLADWEAIKAFLGFLGFDPMFVYITFSPALLLQGGKRIIDFPMSRRAPYQKGRGFYSPPPTACCR